MFFFCAAILVSLLIATVLLLVVFLTKPQKGFALRSPFSQYGPKIQDTTGSSNEEQGESVALSSNGLVLAIGSPGDNNTMGAVWLRDTETHSVLQKVVPVSALGSPNFGVSVAFSEDGTTLAVGGTSDGDDNAGAVWVYILSNNVATFSQKVIASNVLDSAHVGQSVALSSDGKTLAIGAPQDGAETEGATVIWARNGSGTYTQQAKLVGSGATGNMQQGGSVTLSADGNTCATGGALTNASLGAVWVFVRSGFTWTQQTFLPCPPDAVVNPDVSFGCSCSLSDDGNVLAVGGYGDNNGLGAVWIFRRSTTWSQQGPKIVGTGYNVSALVNQGTSVALSADGMLLLFGGPNDGSTQEGQCWVFEWNGSIWVQVGLPLTGSNGTRLAYQGSAVALAKNGSFFAEGAYADSTNRGAVWTFN